MIRSKHTVVLALLGSASLFGSPLRVHAAPAGEKPVTQVADAALADWVDQHVEAWQPTGEERRFDEVGWARGIQDAERVAKQHGRPVFLFTHDGRMATGRC